MKVVKEIKNTKKPIIMVITGNGRAEFRRLKPIAKRYNEEKTLWFPLTPMPTKKTGISVLEALKLYPTKYKLTSFLFVVDKEHLKEPQKDIKEFLKK